MTTFLRQISGDTQFEEWDTLGAGYEYQRTLDKVDADLKAQRQATLQGLNARVTSVFDQVGQTLAKQREQTTQALTQTVGNALSWLQDADLPKKVAAGITALPEPAQTPQVDESAYAPGALPDFSRLSEITSEERPGARAERGLAQSIRSGTQAVQESGAPEPIKRAVGAMGPRAAQLVEENVDNQNPLSGALSVVQATGLPVAGAVAALGAPDRPLQINPTDPSQYRYGRAPEPITGDTPVLGGLLNPVEAAYNLVSPAEGVGLGRAARNLVGGAVREGMAALPRVGQAIGEGLEEVGERLGRAYQPEAQLGIVGPRLIQSETERLAQIDRDIQAYRGMLGGVSNPEQQRLFAGHLSELEADRAATIRRLEEYGLAPAHEQTGEMLVDTANPKRRASYDARLDESGLRDRDARTAMTWGQRTPGYEPVTPPVQEAFPIPETPRRRARYDAGPVGELHDERTARLRAEAEGPATLRGAAREAVPGYQRTAPYGGDTPPAAQDAQDLARPLDPEALPARAAREPYDAASGIVSGGTPGGSRAASSPQLDAAVERFGVTDNPEDAGYLLPDGRLLNMRAGAEQYGKALYHAQVGQLYPAANGISERSTISRFVRDTGAARMRYDPGISIDLDLAGPLTPQQLATAGRLLRQDGPLVVNVEYRDPTSGAIKGWVSTPPVASVRELQDAVSRAVGGDRSGIVSGAADQSSRLASPSSNFRSALAAAAKPGMARAAETQGERLFDAGAGLATGTYAAAEDPDASPAERAARFVGGAGAGAFGGAQLRQLGRAGKALTENIVTDAPRRAFHGTGTTFAKPDPSKFDPNGMYGPGYYVTSDPRVASSYADARSSGGLLSDWTTTNDDLMAARAMVRDTSLPAASRRFYEKKIVDLEKRLAMLQPPAGAQVRPVEIPEGARLLDVDAPLDPDEATRIVTTLRAQPDLDDATRLRLNDVLERYNRGESVSGNDVWYALAGNDLRTRDANALRNQRLAAAGFDGIKYSGGQRIPLRDEAGNAIEHDAYVLFPETGLPKTRNLLSGEPMGIVAGEPPRSAPSLRREMRAADDLRSLERQAVEAQQDAPKPEPAAAVRARLLGLPLPTLSEAASAAQAAPLAAPPSLLTNFLGGAFRTLQRLGQEAPGGPGEALADVAAMGASIPEALARAVDEFKQGPSEALSRGLSPEKGGLERSDALLAKILTFGSRANVATDRFWNTLNEAGGMARARFRGLDEVDAADVAAQAGEFATYRGQVSPVAESLSHARKWVDDPKAHPGKRALGAFIMGTSPYVRTPERVLLATLSLVTDPFTQPARILKALRDGDNEIAREATGRLLLGTAVNTWLAHEYLSGGLRGAPPRDQARRKEEEAKGAKWDTLHGIPLRYLGTFGEAAGAVASTMAAAQAAAEKGQDPTGIAEAGANEAMRWALNKSYLRELVRFGADVRDGRFLQAGARVGAGLAARPVAPITSAVGAIDPYEREVKGAGAEVLNRVPGGRYALPTRKSASGQSIRRSGTGLSRALFGSSGSEAEAPRTRQEIVADARRQADEARAQARQRAGAKAAPETPIAAIVRGLRDRVSGQPAASR
ncbi:MAG TPA: hypothetical protein VD948_08635 [Rhodothermales bacterium]|nr:hypothetical protein [Rhodothermales bacterium]